MKNNINVHLGWHDDNYSRAQENLREVLKFLYGTVVKWTPQKKVPQLVSQQKLRIMEARFKISTHIKVSIHDRNDTISIFCADKFW